MTARFSNLKRLFVFAVLTCVATGAFARYNDCSAPLPMTINIPSVGIPANLPNGQTIPGAQASFSIPINCTVNPGGVWWDTAFSGSYSPVPGYVDVYTAPGMGAGVGFRMRNAACTVIAPVSNGGTINTFEFGAAQQGANTVQGSFELVKVGSAAAGSFGFSTALHVQNSEWANNGSQAGSMLMFSYTVTGTAVPTCSVTTSFGISMTCDANARPSISLTDAAAPSNQSHVLTLSSGSTAAGVGIQLLYQMQPLPFGAAGYVYTGGNPSVTNSTSLGVRSGTTNVDFSARYVQTATSVNPGTVKAVATFNLSYN
jgi:type 1 fimbria pilin